CFSDEFSSSGYAKGGAEYLKLPAHSYSSSLSGAVTSWRDGIAGFQYNPAIMENLYTYHLAMSNTFWMDDRVFYAFEAAGPIGNYLVIGGSLINAGVKTIERRNEFGTLEGYFSDEELAVALAVAGRLQWNISWGVAGRYLVQKLDNEDAYGMGFDIGATFQPDSAFCIGISLLNCASFLWWSTDRVDKVLLQARGGVTGKFIDKMVAVSCDLIKTLEQPVDIALGLQYTLLQILSLRMGMSTSVHRSSPKVRDPDISIGAGLRYSYYGIDYSCTIPIEKYGIIHRASIILEFSL
ncbi:MAG: hypothetical protein PVI26_14915, partial [Chitinispirillia bacterium]